MGKKLQKICKNVHKRAELSDRWGPLPRGWGPKGLPLEGDRRAICSVRGLKLQASRQNSRKSSRRFLETVR
jgi:hypothetical protein